MSTTHPCPGWTLSVSPESLLRPPCGLPGSTLIHPPKGSPGSLSKNTALMSHSPACHSQWSSVSLRIESHPSRYSKPPPSCLSEWLLTKRQEITSAGEGQGSLACCSPWGRKESDTQRLNECWRGCGGKGTLVRGVGIQLGPATMENSMELPQNIRHTMGSTNSTPGYVS